MVRGVSELVPGFGGAVSAGAEAVRGVQNGLTAKEIQTRATGMLAADVIGGKIGGVSAKVVRGLTSTAVKTSAKDIALGEAIGYAAGKGLTGAMGEVEGTTRPGKARD